MISVDAYLFLVFSDLTCHIEDAGIDVFWCIVPPDSKETELGSNNQESSPSAGKITGIVVMPCCARKCVPTAISDGAVISKVPGYHLLRQMSSQ